MVLKAAQSTPVQWQPSPSQTRHPSASPIEPVRAWPSKTTLDVPGPRRESSPLARPASTSPPQPSEPPQSPQPASKSAQSSMPPQSHELAPKQAQSAMAPQPPLPHKPPSPLAQSPGPDRPLYTAVSRAMQPASPVPPPVPNSPRPIYAEPSMPPKQDQATPPIIRIDVFEVAEGNPRSPSPTIPARTEIEAPPVSTNEGLFSSFVLLGIHFSRLCHSQSMSSRLRQSKLVRAP